MLKGGEKLSLICHRNRRPSVHQVIAYFTHFSTSRVNTVLRVWTVAHTVLEIVMFLVLVKTMLRIFPPFTPSYMLTGKPCHILFSTKYLYLVLNRKKCTIFKHNGKWQVNGKT